MIYGIGIDIVAVQRLRDSHSKLGMKFFERVFTSKEIEHCFGMKDPFPSLAVRFAAKESVIKAIGGEAAANLRDIETLNSESGRPYIVFHGKLRSFVEENRIGGCHVSLSHERDYGIAFVLLERL